MVTIAAAILTGYLLGSIPTGVWLGKLFKGIDIRQHGSGSIGATNVSRVLGAKLAVIVLVIDVAKGFLACYLASRVNFGDILLSGGQLSILGGLAAVIGHLFPVFAGFRGGKGIATGAGIVLYISPLEVGFTVVVFISIAYLTRFVSLASITAAIFYCLAILVEKYYMGYPVDDEVAGLAILLVIIVLCTHRSNIRRLMAGTENRFGAKK